MPVAVSRAAAWEELLLHYPRKEIKEAMCDPQLSGCMASSSMAVAGLSVLVFHSHTTKS